MKVLRLLAFAICFVLVGNTANAQWVSIPDTNFATYLNNNGFSACLQGNNTTGWQMDTTCNAVVNATYIECEGKSIADVTGIQYFDNLEHFTCAYNNLSFLPSLPATRKILECSGQWHGIPQSSHLRIDTLPDLPAGLEYLGCAYNIITELPALPATLRELYSDENNLTSLPALPAGLEQLHFSNNQITSIPTLPNGLIRLYCGGNLFTSLPALPPTLQELGCEWLNLTTLPALPSGLLTLYFSGNNLTAMPPLPAQLIDLDCSNNFLTSLGTLPGSLLSLGCASMQLDSLPQLPDSLQGLFCMGNAITTLPALPKTLNVLNTGDCLNLTSLPELPDSLFSLGIENTPDLVCLPAIKYIEHLRCANSGFTCWPNSPSGVVNSNIPLDTFPVCDEFNVNGCAVYWNITGKAYNDLNADCNHNTLENGFMNIKMELWENGTRLAQAIPSEGVYTFDTDHYSTYQVTVDTANIPFRILCPSSGSLTSVISAADSMDYSMDFALECKPGFDLQARSIATEQVFRPANYTEVEISAGDATNFYNANCAAGVSGTVSLLLTGPITFISSAPGGVTPNVTGDTLTWPIADFGTVNFFEDFDIIVQTDTFAQMGQYACFILKVNPIANDNKPSNNTLIYCFTIVNSYDPNDKQAYPAGNIDTAQEELTYTVRFQNTGNAEAQHIYITDTLDANVRPETFELLAYSHQPGVQIDGRAVRFNFPNINLPDSFSNEPGSHGYVQYKVKLKDNLPIGTVINNTAFIYFDFNPPVVTNTATNTVSVDVDTTVSVRNIKTDAQVFVYPNPANGAVTITVSDNIQGSTIIITDVLGRRALEPVTLNNTRTTTINTQQLPEGVYLVNVSSKNGASVTKRLMVSR